MKRSTQIMAHSDGTFTLMWIVSDETLAIVFQVSMYQITQVGHTQSTATLMATDLGYHATEPQYEGQFGMDSCIFLNGKSCYYDGTSLGANALWKDFNATANVEVIWSKLESWFKDHKNNEN